jgi:hypothetical protein
MSDSESADRPTVLVQWPKGVTGPKDEFAKACRLVGGSASAVARQLIEAWTRIILTRGARDIEDAARGAADAAITPRAKQCRRHA